MATCKACNGQARCGYACPSCSSTPENHDRTRVGLQVTVMTGRPGDWKDGTVTAVRRDNGMQFVTVTHDDGLSVEYPGNRTMIDDGLGV